MPMDPLGMLGAFMGAMPQAPGQNANGQQNQEENLEKMIQMGMDMWQKYKAEHGGRCGPRGGWGGHGRGPCGDWKNKMGCHGGPGPWWMHKMAQAQNNGGAWEGCGGHKLKRAKIIKAPEDVQVATPLDSVNFQVSLRNDTHWAYKEGCKLVSLFNEAQKEFLEPVEIPIDQIQAMTNYIVNIPVKVRENAIPNELSAENKEYYTLMFSLQGPRGFSFGETISVKLRVIPKLEDIEIYTRVLQLIENNPNQSLGFEETVAAFRQTGYDSKRTIEMVKAKKEAKKAQEDDESNQILTTNASNNDTDMKMNIQDDDLYE